MFLAGNFFDDCCFQLRRSSMYEYFIGAIEPKQPKNSGSLPRRLLVAKLHSEFHVVLV